MQIQVRVIVIALAAAFFTLGGEENVLASCGDWLADPVDEMKETHVSLDSAIEIEDTSKQPTPSPCETGNCRPAPIAPATPVPLNLKVRGEDLLLRRDGLAVAKSSELRINDLQSNDSRLSGHLSTIDRPPEFSI